MRAKINHSKISESRSWCAAPAVYKETGQARGILTENEGRLTGNSVGAPFRLWTVRPARNVSPLNSLRLPWQLVFMKGFGVLKG